MVVQPVAVSSTSSTPVGIQASAGHVRLCEARENYYDKGGFKQNWGPFWEAMIRRTMYALFYIICTYLPFYSYSNVKMKCGP